MYSAPEIAHLMDRHNVRSIRRARRVRLLRRVLIVVAALVVMAALTYVGPAGAAFDPAPGAAPIALSPDMDLDGAPAQVQRHADYAVHGNIIEACRPFYTPIRTLLLFALSVGGFLGYLVGSIDRRYGAR